MEGDVLSRVEDSGEHTSEDADGGRFAGAWAAVGDGPAWRALTPQDVEGTQAAYRASQRLVARLGVLLVAAGIGGGDLPGLWPSVDAQGRPVVWLGAISAAGAVRLAEILEGDLGARGSEDAG
jgi:hypothetical protein